MLVHYFFAGQRDFCFALKYNIEVVLSSDSINFCVATVERQPLSNTELIGNMKHRNIARIFAFGYMQWPKAPSI